MLACAVLCCAVVCCCSHTVSRSAMVQAGQAHKQSSQESLSSARPAVVAKCGRSLAAAAVTAAAAAAAHG
jgi:hypothetical protein